VTSQELERQRARNYRRLPALKVNGEEEAVRFIEECGFLLLFSVRGVELPDLWQATATRGEAWHWKETLPGAKKCAYGKVLRRKGTFISWEYFPGFMAAYGSPNSYLQDYRAGLLNQVEKQILETLEERGPLLTRELRRAIGLPGKAGTRQFHRALEGLQAQMRVTVAGGILSGWTMHRWELIGNWVPLPVLKEGWRLSREQAQRKLLLRYLKTVVAARVEDMVRLFRWNQAELERLVRDLATEGMVEMGMDIVGLPGKWVVVS